jgi:rubrerythrin
MVNEENIEKLKEMVNQLIKIEEEVVDLTENTVNQAENTTVKYLLRAIQHDSRKHDDMERKHREFITEMKSLTKTPALQYIFEQIWADEKKHHAILETLMLKRFEKDPVVQWKALLHY